MSKTLTLPYGCNYVPSTGVYKVSIVVPTNGETLNVQVELHESFLAKLKENSIPESICLRDERTSSGAPESGF